MEIIDRIILLSEKLGFSSPSAFAQDLGYTHQSMSKWRAGAVISDKALSLIENKFNVNPLWLRQGKGDIFNAKMHQTLPKAELNREILSIIIDEVLKILDNYKPPVKSKAKADVIAIFYEKYMEDMLAEDSKIIDIRMYIKDVLGTHSEIKKIL